METKYEVRLLHASLVNSLNTDVVSKSEIRPNFECLYIRSKRSWMVGVKWVSGLREILISTLVANIFHWTKHISIARGVVGGQYSARKALSQGFFRKVADGQLF